MSRSVRMVGAALIPAFALPLATGNVARAAVPSPPTNSNLPSELDVASPYVPQDTCDPKAKPGVLAFARLMASHYSEFNYGISRACTTGVTEHSEGRALDWMLDAYDSHERAVADSVLAWLMAPDAQGRQGAMARRFGIMYVIWDNQIWGTYRMDDGWREYNGPNPHTDHIHFSFSWDGAMQRTSWWTGKAWTGVSTSPDGPSVPIAPPTSYPVLKEGARGPDVKLAQEVIGAAADGIFGPGTKSALTTWQRNHGLRATGALDTATWDKMVALGEVPARGETSPGTTAHDTVRLGSRGESVKALQRILGVGVDGIFGSKTDAAVRDFQKKKSLKVNGVVDGNVWNALTGTSYTKTGTSDEDTKGDSKGGDSKEIPKTVRRGSTGAAVKKLQRILDITVDGVFGSGTESAVKSFQRRKDLTADGIVGAKTWEALLSRSGGTQSISLASFRGSTGAATVSTTTEFTSMKSMVLAQGARGPGVKKVQQVVGGVAVDGSFGAATTKAVRNFQSVHGLRATGVVDEQTWDALEATKYPFLAYRTTVLKPGSTGPAVTALQSRLDLPRDGVYGPATEQAVRSLQERNGLTRTGYVGAVTWQALEREVRVPA